MKKLEDVPKNEIFDVPEGYFEDLPGRIQQRIAGKQTEVRPVFTFALRYALPAVVLLIIGIFWFNNSLEEKSAETILASVQTEDLVAFLNDDDFTEELLEDASLDNQDAIEIEDAVYGFGDDSFQDVLDEID